MGLHEYHYSRKLTAKRPPMKALIMSAMKKADPENLIKLTSMWPEVWEEFKEREASPLGALESDKVTDIEALKQRVAEFERQPL